MDAGVINPVPGVATAAYVRPTAGAGQGAAATDLPSATAATPAAVVAVARNSPPATDASTGFFTLDPLIGAVIYQVVDTRTQQLIEQVPAQAVLRSRAYENAIQHGATAFEAQVQAADLYV